MYMYVCRLLTRIKRRPTCYTIAVCALQRVMIVLHSIQYKYSMSTKGGAGEAAWLLVGDWLCQEASEKQCVVMTKAARRHGSDVIRYSLRGRNASAGARSSAITNERRRTLSAVSNASASFAPGVTSRHRPEVTSLLVVFLSVADILLRPSRVARF